MNTIQPYKPAQLAAVAFFILSVGVGVAWIIDAVITSQAIEQPRCEKEGHPMPQKYCDERDGDRQ